MTIFANLITVYSHYKLYWLCVSNSYPINLFSFYFFKFRSNVFFKKWAISSNVRKQYTRTDIISINPDIPT